MHQTALDKFTEAYIECALWSSTDQSDESGGEPLDKNYDSNDISAETIAEMIRDCLKFQTENADDIGSKSRRAGHDFWLTRNGHGAGFWDGDWPDDVGTRLTDASHEFGSYDLYIGDDGLIYGM